MGRGIYLLLQRVVRIKRQHRSWEMAPQIKMPAAKSNDMSSTLGTHVVEGKNQLSDHHTSTAVCMYINGHVHTHTHKICIHVYVCKIRQCRYVWDSHDYPEFSVDWAGHLLPREEYAQAILSISLSCIQTPGGSLKECQ